MGSGRTQRQRSELRTAARCAFPHTLPILAGFLFLGMTYGIYMNVSGFSFWYPMFMSMTIFAGSVEFVAVNLLLGAFDPLQALLITLMLNARHLFYGISMLDKYRGTGFKKVFLIFGMCDESFSINYTADIPKDVDRGWFMFFVLIRQYTGSKMILRLYFLRQLFLMNGKLVVCILGQNLTAWFKILCRNHAGLAVCFINHDSVLFGI